MVAAAVVSGWGGAAGKGIGAGGAAGRGAVWLIGSAVVHATKTVNISTLRIITHSLYPFPFTASCTMFTALRTSWCRSRIRFERVICIVKV